MSASRSRVEHAPVVRDRKRIRTGRLTFWGLLIVGWGVSHLIVRWVAGLTADIARGTRYCVPMGSNSTYRSVPQPGSCTMYDASAVHAQWLLMVVLWSIVWAVAWLVIMLVLRWMFRFGEQATADNEAKATATATATEPADDIPADTSGQARGPRPMG